MALFPSQPFSHCNCYTLILSLFLPLLCVDWSEEHTEACLWCPQCADGYEYHQQGEEGDSLDRTPYKLSPRMWTYTGVCVCVCVCVCECEWEWERERERETVVAVSVWGSLVCVGSSCPKLLSFRRSFQNMNIEYRPRRQSFMNLSFRYMRWSAPRVCLYVFACSIPPLPLDLSSLSTQSPSFSVQDLDDEEPDEAQPREGQEWWCSHPEFGHWLAVYLGQH